MIIYEDLYEVVNLRDREVYEFQNTDGSIIRVVAHDPKAKDLDRRTHAMLDLLMCDIDTARYNEYRAILTIKLFSKALMAERDDLCEILGKAISTLMTRKVVKQC
jgi:hypothetical protein